MCCKGQARCPELVGIREAATKAWTRAETFEEVQTAWRRLGGLTCLHRHGVDHYRRMARLRWSA